MQMETRPVEKEQVIDFLDERLNQALRVIDIAKRIIGCEERKFRKETDTFGELEVPAD